MENLTLDVLEELLATISDREISLLFARPDLKESIEMLFSLQSFWLKRVEFVLKSTIIIQTNINEREWNSIYYDLLELGVESKSLQDVFIKACESGKADIVSLLLDDTRIRVSKIEALLINACRNGYLELVEVLLADNRSSTVNLGSLLTFVCKIGNIQLVQLLLSKGAYPSYTYNLPIREAVYENHIEIVRLLMKDKRVDPSDLNNDCIHYAIKQNKVEMASLLLEDIRVNAFANIRKLSDEMNIVVRMGYTNMLELFIDDRRFSSVWIADSNFCVACFHGYYKIVKLLLEYNVCDPTYNDIQCLVNASLGKQKEIETLLRSDPRVKAALEERQRKASENIESNLEKLLSSVPSLRAYFP